MPLRSNDSPRALHHTLFFLSLSLSRVFGTRIQAPYMVVEKPKAQEPENKYEESGSKSTYIRHLQSYSLSTYTRP